LIFEWRGKHRVHVKRVYRNPQGFLQGTKGRFKKDLIRAEVGDSIIQIDKSIIDHY